MAIELYTKVSLAQFSGGVPVSVDYPMELANSIDGFAEAEEQCLSFPGITCKVQRAKQINVKAELFGHMSLWDLDSIVFQHEVDHLDGILFFDRGEIIKKQFMSFNIGRNDLCSCGKLVNNKRLKYKNCCGK